MVTRHWFGWVAVFVLASQAMGQTRQRPLPADVERLPDLVYATVDNRPLRLDLYLPKSVQGRVPVVLGIHGGGWAAGSKAGRMGVWLTSHGYAVACLNYRLSGEATFPAQIEDCKAAVRWLRAHAAEYGLDADRIGAIGHSAGAHLATLLATSGDEHAWDVGEHLEHPSSIRAVVASAGPTDFLQMDDHAPAGARLRHRSAGSPESRLIGGPIEENPELVARANPITYASTGDPPCLLVHGDADATVPVHQSRLLDEALRRASVPVELIVLPGVGHRIGDDLPTERVVAFFDEHLRR